MLAYVEREMCQCTGLIRMVKENEQPADPRARLFAFPKKYFMLCSATVSINRSLAYGLMCTEDETLGMF